jgi:alanyl aminopeptidase
MAIANTLPEQEVVENGWRTVIFRKTKPVPSYLLAIATGPLETVEIPNLGVPARVVTVRGQSHLAGVALETTGPLLRALEAYFGSPYPFDKLDLIAVPEYWGGAMENPGAITYSDNILLIDSQTATLSRKRSLARVTAHELAHMWFGNLVTMVWWDDHGSTSRSRIGWATRSPIRSTPSSSGISAPSKAR